MIIDTGINTEKISALCLEIQDYADKIKNILNQIEDVVDNLEPNFQGDGTKEFKNKFENLKEYFPIIYENITSYIDDLKGSLDNVAEKASALSDNPFSSSNVTSCAIDFSLLDKSIKIDLCQYISQFKNLFYAIFYLALNVFIAFGMFRLFVLILVSI